MNAFEKCHVYGGCGFASWDGGVRLDVYDYCVDE